ncbi:oligosaccharide repeat unit polymerase [Microbacterium stercoris]|uniref:Oligosaccharide repeat unit polymerase n=1 Tax=Microbacterium stercoris TaxID=2820289 RepID=A0A939TXK9_9MICO|nr:oligosaccharide repeat unit polymerase [Microbacterium stercoris]MBO3663752.1 oligosaccharide repeat unit polymerase [Microbacterium stercoris]
MAAVTSKADANAIARHFGGGLLFAVALAAFIGGLEYAYANRMAPRFGYLGYVYHEPAAEWMFATYLMLLITALFLPRRTDRFSGFAVWFLYAAVVVPVATVPLYNSTRDPGDTFLFACYCAAIWAGVALIIRRRQTPTIVPVRLRTDSRLLWTGIVLVSLATYVSVYVSFGISFNVVNVFDVYDTRLDYRDGLASSGPLVGYLIFNQGNVVNPLLMAIGVFRRRCMPVALGVIGQLILYSTAGYKTVLISIPLCIALAFVLRKRKQFSGITVFVGATLLVWGAIIIDRIAPALGIVDLFVSRVFIMAGHLVPFFLQVYDGQPWALWDYSFLGPFVTTPYTMSPGFHVGLVAFGQPEVQANASLFADGYANLGLVGIAIEAAFLVLLLVFVDSASRGIPIAIVIPTALLPVFAIANASPFTALFSLGFALMFVLFAVHPRSAPERAPEDAPALPLAVTR